MNLRLRGGKPEDAKVRGAICYEAFKTIAEAHRFTPDFPSVDVAVELMTSMLGHAGFYAVVAELDGKVVGSNFLYERSCIACVGPIPVDPSVQHKTPGDVDACNRVCRQVHGHDRGGELRDAVGQGTASVVEHDGRITGYTTTLGFFGHAVGESNSELQALIAAAQTFAGPGFLLPIRNTTLFRWRLQRGLRVTQPITLMTRGLYNEPAGT